MFFTKVNKARVFKIYLSKNSSDLLTSTAVAIIKIIDSLSYQAKNDFFSLTHSMLYLYKIRIALI